jgi:hypothetical protein
MVEEPIVHRPLLPPGRGGDWGSEPEHWEGNAVQHNGPASAPVFATVAAVTATVLAVVALVLLAL